MTARLCMSIDLRISLSVRCRSSTRNATQFKSRELGAIDRAHRLIVLDSGEQVIKSNAKISDYSDDGVVECSTVGYRNRIVPDGNTYSQGIDIHSGARWIIRDNLVQNIRSSLPSGEAVAGAISLWNGSFDSIVERNLVVDCWQGIQLGGNSDATSPDLARSSGYQHSGGIVRNNVVVRSLDFGIQLARSEGARVDHNTVWTPDTRTL